MIAILKRVEDVAEYFDLHICILISYILIFKNCQFLEAIARYALEECLIHLTENKNRL